MDKVKIDFDIFARLFYLVMKKAEIESEDYNRDEMNEQNHEFIEEQYMEDENSDEDGKDEKNNKIKQIESDDFYDV